MADAEHIREAARFVGQLDARMGGTEIGAALDAAYRGGPGDVLLITDGEVWNDTDVVGRAEQFGKRIFTVGVGSSVAEAFVRELAECTGGACELVSPGEDMAERIVRHFRRMDQPRAVRAGVEWSAAVRRQVPESIDAVYGGDTLHLLAWLAEPPSDHATLRLTLEDGRELCEQVTFAPIPDTGQEDADVIPRVAARRRLRDRPHVEASELAVRYQLVTEHTSCVLVYGCEADGKAEKVPALRKVPQVLAAGWGGVGSARVRRSRLAASEAVDLDLCLSMERSAAYRKARGAADHIDSALSERAFDEAVMLGDTVLRQLMNPDEAAPAEWAYLRGFRERELQRPPDDEVVRHALRRRLLVTEEADQWRLRVPLMRRWLRKRG